MVAQENRVHLHSLTKGETEELDTSVKPKAQKSYKRKCEKLGLRYEPLRNRPRGLKSILNG